MPAVLWPASFAGALWLAAAPQPSATPAAPTRVAAGVKVREPETIERAARLQTLLARRGFSPGLIDGKPGRKTRIALETYQRSRGLPVTGEADDATRAALAQDDPAARDDAEWTRRYTINAEDVALITGPIPEDWNERAELEVSGYADMHELLAERGWCSRALVERLNPGVDLLSLRAGDSVTLPDTRNVRTPNIARLEIDLSEKLILGFDARDRVVVLTHCSIARSVEKRPVGKLGVKVVAADPDYTFDPRDWAEVTNVTRKLRIAPGPRNPVGSAWIGLDRPGYGIHGTVRPEDIGKTGSHGCFRTLNWEALRLAHAVSRETVVEVKE
ncbi:MAG: L,D-transpeptidase [Planctomycetota bacterium]|nr:L,D-transpeptidase [Planctomycetota bacterium]